MKPLFRSFSMFVKQILRDSMLITICFAVILTALFTRYGVPALEGALCGYFHVNTILSEYYLMFDLLLAVVTPYMLSFASSLMMLTEFDENMSSYLSITPVGKNGYLISRLGLPSAISYLLSVLLLSGFSLTKWTAPILLATGILSCLSSAAVAMLLFSYSHNRVEGMAMGKLAGILMLGLFAPFFIKTNVQYLFAVLPSFWIAKLSMEQNVLYFLPGLVCAMLWLFPLMNRFQRKIA